MKYFIGLDLSLTSTGMVVVSEDGVLVEKEIISSDSKNEIENRLKNIADKIVEILKKYDDVAIAIEGLSFGSTSSSALQIGALHYYVRCKLKENGYTFLICEPTKVKKFVTGLGNCKKDLIILKVYQKWGEEFSISDLADAYS